MSRRDPYLFFFLCLLPVLPLSADIMHSDDNWSTSSKGWESKRPWATSPAFGSRGVTNSGWLSVTSPVTVLPAAALAEQHSRGRVPASRLFAGGRSNAVSGGAGFLSSSARPQHLIKRQWSYTADTNVWGYSLMTGTNLNTTASDLPGFINAAAADYPETGLDQYLSDLNSRDWTGMDMRMNAGIKQVKDVDNLQLWIPEPAEIFLLAVAVIVSVAAIRRRSKPSRSSAGSTRTD